MEISIRSEADSRMLVYPLIKVLANYGTVAVYTSNRFLTRLIEGELEGGFKNIRVVVSPEQDEEFVRETDEYEKGKYDFIIWDNMGVSDYDILIAILTGKLSESYTSDLLYIISDPKTSIIKFGKGTKPVKKQAPPKPKKGKPGEVVEEDTVEEEDAFEFNKWNKEKTDEEVLQELVEGKEAKWIPFPTYDSIEDTESTHMLPVPSDALIKELYRIMGKYLSVDERMFTKGARVKDESSGVISGTNVG